MAVTLHRSTLADRVVEVVATQRADGDFHPRHVVAATLEARQIAVTGRRWTMLDQVHGLALIDLDLIDLDLFDLDAHVSGDVGDVMVTGRSGMDPAIWAADCAPLVLIADDATIVAAHAGWRGLAAGVVDVAVDTATRHGGRVTAAVVGPVVHPCCYEFGATDLCVVAAGVHTDPSSLTSTTSHGAIALDVPAAVGAALGFHGIELDVVGPCTGCDERWFSHRVRRDTGRHATVVRVRPR